MASDARLKSLFSAGLAAGLMALASPADAIEDAATGLAVEPPPPLTAEFIENANFTIAIGVRSPAGSPQPSPGNEFFCQIGFVIQAKEFTQAELNESTLDPGYIAALAASFDAEFAAHQETTFAVTGVRGVDVAGLEFLATPKDAADNRLYTTLLQTPAGLVQQHCTTTAADIDAALPLFRAIRDSITPP